MTKLLVCACTDLRECACAYARAHATAIKIKDGETENNQEKRLFNNLLPGGLLWDCHRGEINCIAFSLWQRTGDEVKDLALVPEARYPELVLLRHSASQ